jgi:hypothetical protein
MKNAWKGYFVGSFSFGLALVKNSIPYREEATPF